MRFFLMQLGLDRRATGLWALAAAALLSACGGSNDATEKQLADLRAELLKVRADNAALAERLDGVELRSQAPRAPAPAAVAEVAPREHPELDVVRLSPEGGPAASEDPNAEGPRPVLRGTGKTGTVEEAPGARAGQSPAASPKSTPRR